MRDKRLLLAVLPILLAAVSFIPGCDELVTEVNNITLIDTTLGEACLACHADSDTILRAKGQWANSRHASPEFIQATVSLNDSLMTTNQCGPQCHTGQGYIDYIRDGSTTPDLTPSVIHCFACHMPHSGNYGSWDLDTLRGDTIVTPLQANGSAYNMGKSNMCAHCHQTAQWEDIGSSEVTIRADWGPHFSPQADVLNGTGGYPLPSITGGNSHDSVRTRDGCLACHYGTGQGYDFGEHTFRLENDISGTQYAANCNVSGCHGAGGIPASGFYTFSARTDSIDALADSLEMILKYWTYLDPSDADGMRFIKDSTIPAVSAKILYNYLLYKLDGSHGIHNARYIEELLTQSLVHSDSIPPHAIFTADADTICTPYTVSFTDDSKGTINLWLWQFGDGNTSVEQNPIHEYNADTAVSFTVELTVTGPAGSDTETKDNLILVPAPPNASFSTSGTLGCDSAVVAFTNYTTGWVTSWRWDFGDGDSSVTKDPQHTYVASDSFIVTLIATGCAVDTAVETILVVISDEMPQPDFSADTTSGPAPLTVNFTDLSLGSPLAWSWDFGDGSISSEQSPSHTYNTPDSSFTVRLIVTNGCGADTLERVDFITTTAP